MSSFLSLSAPLVVLVATFFCALLVAGAIHRIFFHPLRRWPGPKLAAITGFYRAYYDILMDGGMPEKLESLHKRYGPVVRIAPNELHFSDPRAYGGIYSQWSKFTKQPELYSAFAMDAALFGTIDPHDAKLRKELLTPSFSRRAIIKLERVIQEKVDKLVSRLASLEDVSHSTNIYMALRSTSLDVISSYCFARCVNALDAPAFHHPLLVSMESALLMLWIFKYFPLVKLALLNLPSWMPVPELQKGLLDLRKNLTAQIDALVTNPDTLADVEHETIYHHLLLPQPEKGKYKGLSRASLLAEAESIILAGTDTVGNTCMLGTFYVLNDRDVRMRLVRELEEAWPDVDEPMGYEALEKLPYLTGVIKESLRLSYGTVTPVGRVVGPVDADIAGNSIPAGTVVSISHPFIHNNPEIFPNPSSFLPERWVSPNADSDLDSYLVSFAKGPRSCIGINLAWCELYLIMGNVFRKLDLELHDTSIDDLKYRDYFIPHYRGKQLHAYVKKRAI